LEGNSTINGKSARLLLYADGFGGKFTTYGSSQYALLLGKETVVAAGQYVSHETLSSLICCAGQFYRLKFEGQRSKGHVARAMLLKDTSPTGALAVKLVGSNALEATISNLYLQGVDDRTVFFRLEHLKDKLPVGAYVLRRGSVSYGPSGQGGWEMSFTEGPRAVLEADKQVEVAIGGPTLNVQAIEERDRYSMNTMNTPSASVFKKGARLYFEPRIVGKDKEVFSRFRQRRADAKLVDTPPNITITGPNGKVLLTKAMEYG
jgi:hypothetical protein